MDGKVYWQEYSYLLLCCLDQLKCVAEVTSAKFVSADTSSQLINSMEELILPHKQVEALLYGTQ